MSNRDKEWLRYALLVAVILVAGYFGIRYPLPEMPEDVESRLEMLEAHLGIGDIGLQAVGPTRFRTILVDHEATIAGALTASGGVVGDVTGNVVGNVTGDLTGDMVGDLVNSNFLILTEQAAVSVTVQAYITPTGTYQPLTSAAAVSTSLVTAIMSGTTAGELLILVNENASDAITIVDEANVRCGGDKVLTGGQGDSLYLLWDGLDWLCIGYNDN
jgi:hypothetical protein